MKANKPERLLVIALDAAEVSLVERWMADGTLPNLSHLVERGTFTRSASTADWLVGTPWPTFYTGVWPVEHGFYNYLQWRPELMKHQRPSGDWLPLRPFWRDLGRFDRKVIALDVPLTYPPEPFDGVEISGWASHDKLWPPAAHPKSVLNWINREFGPPPLSPEIAGLQGPSQLLKLRDQLIQATLRVSKLARTLMHREAWDLFIIGFAATHRGGHKLWDQTGVYGAAQAHEEAELSQSLHQIYAACDAAVGELVRAAGSGVRTLVFALHGMGPNTSCSVLLPAMLRRILNGGKGDSGTSTSRQSVLNATRNLLPLELRSAIKRRLPQEAQDGLTMFWRRGQFDRKPQTRAFCLNSDLEGYIQVNLRGREASGTVEPGREHEGLCEQIADGLRSFVDSDTGDSVIERIGRGQQLYPGISAENCLPDLIIHWAQTPAARRRAVSSPRYGSIPWPTPGRNPDGRSGHHRSEGFLVAAGEGIFPATRIEPAHILDLAPTIYQLLGVPKAPGMRGQAISLIRSGLGVRDSTLQSAS
jgi:predicted AlkP superfamily phosphohydrolase/phosphomutase